MSRQRGGFSLVEVVMAIGIVTFSVIAMLAIFPIGLKQNAASVHETRAVHLARTMFAALRSLPRDGADCFGKPLSPSGLRSSATAFDRNQPQACYYAVFPAETEPKIGGSREGGSTYRIGLWFRQIGTMDKASASRVTMVIQPLDQSGSFQFESVVEDGQ